ncbi:MAG TPA: YoaK family protein [Trebonia sp.]
MAEAGSRPGHVPLVGLLTFTSGGVDVVTLMVIGGAFTSVITGNLIFVGRAVGTSSLNPALHAIMAVAGYVLGVAAGSRLRLRFGRRGPQAAWPRSATLVLAAEWAVLAAVNVAWIGYDAAPPAAATDVLLVAAALALGLQGAAARAIKGSPSTTYMTGALTALVEALATGARRSADASAAVGLLALVAGAACSAVLVEHAPRVALVPPVVSLALVVAVKWRQHQAEQRVATATGPV